MSSKADSIATQKQSWNTFASGWQTWDSFIQNWMAPVGQAMIEATDLTETDRVLDAATGTGEPGLSAARLVVSGEVVGTDVAEGMVDAANQNAKDRDIQNYHAVTATTHDLPFESASFDAALSRFGVIFSPEVPADVRELTRVVKPGGTVTAAAWAQPEKNYWAVAIPRIIHDIMNTPPPPKDAPGVFRCAQPDSLPAIMREAGLREVTSREVTGDFTVKSPEQFWEIMLDIAAPIVSALASADDTVRDEVRNRTLTMLRENYIKDDQVVIPWSAWVVSGHVGD